MVNHTNRGRLTVDLGGNWRLYTNIIPPSSKALGIVERGILGDRGALVLINSTGIYAQINAGAIRSLPQDKVAAAVASARAGRRGGPGLGGGMKAADGATCLARKQVKLDAASIEALLQSGDGNLSLGIRRAAKLIKPSG